MNDQLQELLIKYIEQAEGTVSAGIDEMMKHAPDLVSQLLLWKTIDSAVPFTLFFLTFLFALYCYVSGWTAPLNASYPLIRELDAPNGYCHDTSAEPTYSWSEEKSFKLICGFFGMVVSMIFMWINSNWFMILIAPKFYLFEYAKSLV